MALYVVHASVVPINGTCVTVSGHQRPCNLFPLRWSKRTHSASIYSYLQQYSWKTWYWTYKVRMRQAVYSIFKVIKFILITGHVFKLSQISSRMCILHRIIEKTYFFWHHTIRVVKVQAGTSCSLHISLNIYLKLLAIESWDVLIKVFSVVTLMVGLNARKIFQSIKRYKIV